jgi:hypothetical protein
MMQESLPDFCSAGSANKSPHSLFLALPSKEVFQKHPNLEQFRMLEFCNYYHNVMMAVVRYRNLEYITNIYVSL